MQIKHVCQRCGEVMAVHEHASWQEVKDCQAGSGPCALNVTGGQGVLPFRGRGRKENDEPITYR
jgi:hypothetical protein